MPRPKENIKYEFTEEEIRRLAAKGRPLAEKSIQMLCRNLLDNIPQNKVAKEFGVPPQAVSRAKQKLIDRKLNKAKGNTVEITVQIHKHLVRQLENLMAKSDAMVLKDKENAANK